MWPDFQDGVLQRVVVGPPVVPVDTVSEARVIPAQVKTIQVGVVAGRVPPGAGEPNGAVAAPGVVVTVDGAELGAPRRKTLS